MMKQYQQIKSKYQDCLLFYRMGDFYELFMEDAHIGARVLNITLTSKSNGKNGKIPMAGVPYHAVDSYLSKLVKAGYKVAICEQLSPPNKKGLVERDVVRIVTPGTVLDEKVLEKSENNYIVSIDKNDNLLAISCADISTGFFGTYEVEYTDLAQTLRDEFAKITASECILPERLYNDPELLKILRGERGLNIFPYAQWDMHAQESVQVLQTHFNIKTLESFGIGDMTLALKSSAALLGYLQHTQKATVSHIKTITNMTSEEHMILDRASMINLELFSTIREHDTKGSLLQVLDHTQTAMGARMLKTWLKKPLVDKTKIDLRLDAVEVLQDLNLQNSLCEQLQKIPDIERILSRLSVNIGNARDLVNLKHALMTVLSVKEITAQQENVLLRTLSEGISRKLNTVIDRIENTIVPEPVIDTKSGGIIQEGVHNELDKLRKIVNGSREWIDELERDERERTGISSLKIKFNKVFGFYIEVSKPNLHLVPDSYTRKQTLVNGERFVTPELKHHEEIILTAQERINILEYEIFLDVLSNVLSATEHIQSAASSIAVLDCLLNFSILSVKNEYVRPKMLYSGEIRIQNGRHPVVEKLLDSATFVPNDVTLDTISQQLLIITGPNMAGKSVFIRQVALTVLMAQIGCFVPATSAHISVVDRIFVRSGASDMITSGLSTFMVEMVETAHILHNATKNSLIVMDEIGRGTSTYDGISIAWAVAEYLVSNSFKIPDRHDSSEVKGNVGGPPKTLFATHYHELQALEEQYPNKIKNFHMAVADDRGTPIFLHTIMPGGASHSFGVAVAKLAGIPEEVISKAKEILAKLEERTVEDTQQTKSALESKFSIHDTDLVDHLIHKELESIDISRMTPLDALITLASLKEKITLFRKNEQTKNLD